MENHIFKSQDIYNERQRIREVGLNELTTIQALMPQLFRREDWFVDYYPCSGPVQRSIFAG